MKITLDTEELISLVSHHVQGLGLKGTHKITFNKRNQNNIDTSIEIITNEDARIDASEEAPDKNPSEAIESHIDSLIK